MMFLFAQLEWLGFVFLIITVITFIYDPMKKRSKLAWEDMKKTDAFVPDAKLDSYVKGASKQFAEGLIGTPHTEYNFRKAADKTPQLAKNFFTELKEIFK
jgi:hypothetical protein